VNFVEVAAALLDRFATSGVCDGGEVANGGGESPGVDKFSVAGSGSNMLLVAKASAAKDAMKF
jgi:hypothetical protein